MVNEDGRSDGDERKEAAAGIVDSGRRDSVQQFIGGAKTRGIFERLQHVAARGGGIGWLGECG